MSDVCTKAAFLSELGERFRTHDTSIHMSAKATREKVQKPFLKTLFKGLALIVGSGLLLRAGARRGKTGDPILERLDRAELKLTHIEKGQSPAGVGEIQDWIQTIERRNAEQINAVGVRLDAFEHRIPELINVAVTARIQEVEQRIAMEIRETQSLMIQALVETIDARVTKGIAHVESSLIAHSQEISDLAQRMNQTDANLVRILRILEGQTFAGVATASETH